MRKNKFVKFIKISNGFIEEVEDPRTADAFLFEKPEGDFEAIRQALEEIERLRDIFYHFYLCIALHKRKETEMKTLEKMFKEER